MKLVIVIDTESPAFSDCTGNESRDAELRKLTISVLLDDATNPEFMDPYSRDWLKPNLKYRLTRNNLYGGYCVATPAVTIERQTEALA
jgi:hypothetical protein